MLTLSKDNFKGEILDYKGVAVVMFTTPWDVNAAKAEDFYKARTDIKFGTVNFDEERELVHQYSIRQLPFYLAFKDGKLRVTGFDLKKFDTEVSSV